MSGLICSVCGTPWQLGKPLLYHHDQLHCDSHACSRTCEECKDWEHAVEDGGTQARAKSPEPSAPAEPPPGSFTKAPGYAAMMARLKGGESK